MHVSLTPSSIIWYRPDSYIRVWHYLFTYLLIYLLNTAMDGRGYISLCVRV